MAIVPLTVACLTYVAAFYQLPVELLAGLRQVEGGKVGQVTVNRDSQGQQTSIDIGPFQINDRIWLRPLMTAWRLPSEPATFALLHDNGCANALAASAIFRFYLNEAKGDYGIAVGYYNSHTPQKAERYRRRVALALKRLRGQQAPNGR